MASDQVGVVAAVMTCSSWHHRVAVAVELGSPLCAQGRGEALWKFPLSPRQVCRRSAEPCRGPQLGGQPSPRAGVPWLLKALHPVCLSEEEQRWLARPAEARSHLHASSPPSGPEASLSLISLYLRAVVCRLWTLCQHSFLKKQWKADRESSAFSCSK